MDLLALSRDLIAANTASSQGTRAAVEILRPLYQSAGFDVRVQQIPNAGEQEQNLLATYSGADPAGLLLATHLDTVDAGPLEWWTETGGDPWRMVRKEDRLYGLGSADTKLDALCKLMAARQYAGRVLRRRLQLLGTCGEEVGAIGARHFVRSPEFAARFVACSEPSELTIIRAHKGYAVVEVEIALPEAPRLSGPFELVTFDGKSAHSSTPHLGVNAVEKALDVLVGERFVSLEGGTASNKVPARCEVVRPVRGEPAGAIAHPEDSRDASQAAKLARQTFALWRSVAQALSPQINPAFDPSHCVVNWGIARIHGPRGELTFDCRLLPGHEPEVFLSTFAQRAEDLAHASGARIDIRVSRANPAMELREPSELLSAARAACRDVGLDDQPKTKPTNTEAGVFMGAGAESFVFGPGRSTGNAHTANEHNLYSQMSRATEFYRALIARICT